MSIIEQYMNLPKSCYINARVPKKTFLENPEFDLKKDEKVILKEVVESIYWEYSLKPSILNISSFEDEELRIEEIEIMNVKINDKAKGEKVCNLIQKYIPYPMVIMLQCEEDIKFNISIKKINKVEKSKLVIEDMLYTEWINTSELAKKEIDFINSFDITKHLTNNLWQLYEGFVNSINSFNLSKYKNQFEVKSIDETAKDIEALQEIEKLQNEVILLKAKLKKESNMGTKVELNVRIKKMQKQIESLKINLN